MRKTEKVSNSDVNFECAGVYISLRALGWEWFVIEKADENNNAYGFVQSPLCPEGEFGYFNLNEIKDAIGNIKLETNLEDVLPPAGFRWLN